MKSEDYWLIVVAVSILAFFPLRALLIWFWKVDKLLNLLTSIDLRLSRMEPKQPSDATWKCNTCSNLNPVGVIRCERCHEPRRAD